MQSEVGRILDKYELLERIGQGGMAVVYRGLDRSLGREVAVKILHDHLADSGEARERFEREARAVAKLHHDNIVEIFDFAGEGSEQSYIVTELIRGQTLKDIIAERDIRHPEIGAMVTVQVCRALGHAHSLGILHRDVKPENIMIRADGVVKLMDFGIAQMVDLSRMTVTGQLLGSPAYMSPEHVEGRPLDFRTDVFSAGIVLYQLVCGQLPFSGKNPHEVLKRIGDGAYTDPRKHTPLCGNELCGIIDHALAREKQDRYADVGLMADDLEHYLAEAGLTTEADELARYFEAPVAYEMALRPRLCAALTKSGREAFADSRAHALDLWNRVLAIDPQNEEVLAQLSRLSRRRRGTQALAAAAGVLLIVGLVAGARAVWLDSRSGSEANSLWAGMQGLAGAPVAAAMDAGPATRSDAAMIAAAASFDARPAHTEAPFTDDSAAHQLVRAQNRHGHSGSHAERPDAGAAAARSVTLRVYPPNSQYRIGNGAWTPISGDHIPVRIGPGKITITARNPACCVEATRVIAPSFAAAEIDMALAYLPARVVPKCDVPGVRVQVSGRPARLGRATPIFFDTTLGTRTVEVVFFRADSSAIDKQHVRVTYDQTKTVTCAL